MTLLSSQTITCHSPADMEALARRLSLWARPGLLIRLVGDLGAGKSTFARAFIRALQPEGSTGDIPSPSFSLVQTYSDTRVGVFHADLYRLNDASEVEELGLGDLLASHCGLIEWAERLPHPLTADSLTLAIAGRGEVRTVTLTATGGWANALARDAVITRFLAGTPQASSARHFLEGDASFRRYEKLVMPQGESFLLMDMPQRPDGPPVKDGKPYSAVAHLAENISAVVAVNTHLVSLGYSAPRIFSVDLEAGLAVIEPLGDSVYGRMVLAGADMRQPLMAAVEVLADMARHRWPEHPAVTADAHRKHHVAPYDAQAMLIEVDLLPSWYYPHVRGTPIPAEAAQAFSALWQKLLPLAHAQQPVWVLRDYHSPNLLWMPWREGLQRVGLIDTQDAVMGHPAYDVVSMTQDARVDMDEALCDAVVDHYCTLRHRQGHFDEASFRTAYAVLGAQRSTKILGIFARLNRRDGKPGYLRHMPRVARFLSRNLSHPALADLRQWYATHVPEVLGEALS